MVSLKFTRLTLCRVEHALRRAYCSPNLIRALAPEVNLPLTSAVEAETSRGSQFQTDPLPDAPLHVVGPHLRILAVSRTTRTEFCLS